MRILGNPSVIEEKITSVAAATMSPTVGRTQRMGAPPHTMINAPAKKMTRPVPRSCVRISSSGTSNVPQRRA